MTIAIHVDHDNRRIVGVASGTLEGCDLFDYQKEAEKFPGYDEIFDGTSVDRLQDINPSNLKKLAGVAAATDIADQRTKLAIVAAQDLYFGLGRMYESLRECTPNATKEVAVFHTLAEAEQWLAAKPE